MRVPGHDHGSDGGVILATLERCGGRDFLSRVVGSWGIEQSEMGWDEATGELLCDIKRLFDVVRIGIWWFARLGDLGGCGASWVVVRIRTGWPWGSVSGGRDGLAMTFAAA